MLDFAVCVVGELSPWSLSAVCDLGEKGACGPILCIEGTMRLRNPGPSDRMYTTYDTTNSRKLWEGEWMCLCLNLAA